MPPVKSRKEALAKLRQEAQRKNAGGAAHDKAAASAAPAAPAAQADNESVRSGGSVSARGPRPSNGAREQGPLSARGMGDMAYASGDADSGDLLPNWSTFDKLAATLQERESVKAKAQKRELQERFRRDLEQQVIDSKLKKVREREADNKYHEDMLAQNAKFFQKEEDKVAQAKQRAMGGLYGLQESADQCNRRKQEEIQKEKAHALALAQATQRAVEEDIKKEAEKLAMKRQKYKEVLQANQADKERGLKKANSDEEALLAQQEEFRLRRQAREKMVEDAKMAKVERRQNISENMGNRLNDNAQMLAQELDRKALAERAAMDKKSFDREMEKKFRLQNERQDIQRHQIGQMLEKREAKKAALEQKKYIAEQLETEIDSFEREQQIKSSATRQRNVQFRQELEQQIQAKNAKADFLRDGMSENELRINRRLLENAQQILGTGIALPPTSM